jgi:hypothetical protein
MLGCGYVKATFTQVAVGPLVQNGPPSGLVLGYAHIVAIKAVPGGAKLTHAERRVGACAARALGPQGAVQVMSSPAEAKVVRSHMRNGGTGHGFAVAARREAAVIDVAEHVTIRRFDGNPALSA